MLMVGFSVLAAPVEADQKWLEAVQKMVEKGKNNVSTPSQARVDLVKKWAAAKGLTVAVSKTEAGFQLELSKNLARN